MINTIFYKSPQMIYVCFQKMVFKEEKNIENFYDPMIKYAII